MVDAIFLTSKPLLSIETVPALLLFIHSVKKFSHINIYQKYKTLPNVTVLLCHSDSEWSNDFERQGILYGFISSTVNLL